MLNIISNKSYVSYKYEGSNIIVTGEYVKSILDDKLLSIGGSCSIDNVYAGTFSGRSTVDSKEIEYTIYPISLEYKETIENIAKEIVSLI